MRKFNSPSDVQITVCSIMKNEEKYLRRFLDSLAPAHRIYLEDTGSTDSSYEIAKEYANGKYKGKLILSQFVWGANFEFDKARNHVLEKIPSPEDGGGDAVLHIDLDSFMLDGWYEAFQKTIFEHPNFRTLGYGWDDGRSSGNLLLSVDRSHRNEPGHVKFISPLHETLEFTEEYERNSESSGYVIVSNTVPYQHGDYDPAKDRSFYCELGEKAIDIYPNELERYIFTTMDYEKYGNWEKALCVYIRCELHADAYNVKGIREILPTRIAKCFSKLGRTEEAEYYYQKGCDIQGAIKENFIEYAQWLAYRNRPHDALEILERAQSISPAHDWRHNAAYNQPWKEAQIKADAYCWLGLYKEAVEIFEKALKESQDKRWMDSEGFYADYEFAKNHLENSQKIL